jgi:cob(I)alamin adenosyltransferase
MSKPSPKKGYLHVYTGDGKGKTTAALGLAMRALGHKKKVAIIFFDKGGQNYGERSILKKLKIPFFVTGLNRVIERPNKKNKIGKFRFGVTLRDKVEGGRGIAIFRNLLKKKYDMIILDEINTAVALGVVEHHNFLSALQEWDHSCELICTGRNASKQLLEMADLVTEMVPQKHYFTKHIPARKGIEY